MTSEDKLRWEGACEMLESIRASLKMYPDGGGDIEIMQSVDRLVKEAYERGLDART